MPGSPGTGALDPRGGGTLSRGNLERPIRGALMPGVPFDATPSAASLRRVGATVIDHGIDGDGPVPGGPRPAGSPAHPASGRGVSVGRLVRRDGTRVDAGHPARLRASTGGTCRCRVRRGRARRTAARGSSSGWCAQGRTVGITAFSHAAIGNLIEAVLTRQPTAGVEVPRPRSPTTDQASTTPRSRRTTTPGDLARRRASTSSPAPPGSSPARPGRCARLPRSSTRPASSRSPTRWRSAPRPRNLVLVGDPQQLAQPSKGTHPRGAGAVGARAPPRRRGHDPDRPRPVPRPDLADAPGRLPLHLRARLRRAARSGARLRAPGGRRARSVAGSGLRVAAGRPRGQPRLAGGGRGGRARCRAAARRGP